MVEISLSRLRRCGCTEFLEYSRFLSLPREEFCDFWTEHLDRRALCGVNHRPRDGWGYVYDDDLRGDAGKLDIVGFHVLSQHDLSDRHKMPACYDADVPQPSPAPGALAARAPPSRCSTAPRMAVVRGPWERLVSGFVGKMYNTYGGSCGDGQGGGNETCFRDNFMARYDVRRAAARTPGLAAWRLRDSLRPSPPVSGTARFARGAVRQVPHRLPLLARCGAEHALFIAGGHRLPMANALAPWTARASVP